MSSLRCGKKQGMEMHLGLSIVLAWVWAPAPCARKCAFPKGDASLALRNEARTGSGCRAPALLTSSAPRGHQPRVANLLLRPTGICPAASWEGAFGAPRPLRHQTPLRTHCTLVGIPRVARGWKATRCALVVRPPTDPSPRHARLVMAKPIPHPRWRARFSLQDREPQA